MKNELNCINKKSSKSVERDLLRSWNPHLFILNLCIMWLPKMIKFIVIINK